MIAQPVWVVFRFIPVTNDNPSIPYKLFRQYNVVNIVPQVCGTIDHLMLRKRSV
jgi:hypothetical protein